MLPLTEHVAYNSAYLPQFSNQYCTHTGTKPLGVRLAKLLLEHRINVPQTMSETPNKIEPWVMNSPIVDYSLHRFKRGNTPDYIYRTLFLERTNKYKNYKQVFTDGSKTGSGVGSAFMIDGVAHGYSLNNVASIFTAELFAIKKAMEYLLNSKEKKIIICSDSRSSLEAICKLDTDNKLIQSIHTLLYSSVRSHKSVIFLWIPGHTGISNNEAADRAAKDATLLNDKYEIILPSDWKSFLRPKIMSQWIRDWELVPLTNKLRNIKSTPMKWVTSCRNTRREEVVLSRLRIGHTLFTHGYIFKREEPPICSECNNVPLTVRHILVECPKYSRARQKCNISSQMEEVLKDDENSVQNTLRFLKDINVFNSM
ncbi:uncharacterized protein [Rhodnius prolixus]|uniref:uncharacterized protein n=1 Tax=Rhodnius prolixus TaxID=13249 RepID=UPI003D188B93